MEQEEWGNGELRYWVGKQTGKVVGRGEGCKRKTQELSLSHLEFVYSQFVPEINQISLYSPPEAALSSFVCKSSSFSPLIPRDMTCLYISLVPSIPLHLV